MDKIGGKDETDDLKYADRCVVNISYDFYIPNTRCFCSFYSIFAMGSCHGTGTWQQPS